tara:strand:+ start:1048 stop:1419 length:372 start_codon:yes stop_codon:yes gene_type:complete
MKEQIKITVDSKFIPNQSNPIQKKYLFLYNVLISNESVETVQLLSRYWKITNGVGKVDEVRGPGVVGEKPIIKAGQFFKYMSFCPLTTPIGFMEGHYGMIDKQRKKFNVPIDRFNLVMPEVLN